MNNQAQTENTIRTNKDFWFACVDIDVLRDKELSQSARFIFAVLCTFITINNRNCWPSNDTVAEAAGVSKSTVKRAYQELETRGIIERSTRFNDDSGQTSSYTRIVGHNAACYDDDDEGDAPVNYPQFTDELPPSSPVNHKGNQVKYIKDSLTGEAVPPSSEKSFTPEDAPKGMYTTAQYLLFKTGRKTLTEAEISALRELDANQYPQRVQNEIDKTCERFRRYGTSLETLTFCYIAGALRNQPSLKGKRKSPANPKPADIGKYVHTYSNEEADALYAETEALQAELDAEDERRRNLS